MRKKQCKRCGKVFETDKQGAYLCPACSTAAKRDSVIRARACRECGIKFEGGPRAWYCPQCRAERKKESTKRHHKAGTLRKIGSTDICVRCGKPYIVASGRQKYCPDCKDEAVKEVVRPHKREYTLEHEDKEYKEAMRSYNKVCVICGKVFDSGLPTVTCSPECARERKRQLQREADARRRSK